MIFSYLLNMQSHPSWVCGLKRPPPPPGRLRRPVTPFVGVWIETSHRDKLRQKTRGHTLRGCVD